MTGKDNDVGCVKTTKIQWNKAYLCIPKEHMIPNKYINCKKFEVSYEREPRPIMYNLLSWEYSRIWLNEHSTYHKNRKKNETIPFIKPNVKEFVKSHTIKKKPPKSNFKMKRFENIEARIDHKIKLKNRSIKSKKQFTSKFEDANVQCYKQCFGN